MNVSLTSAVPPATDALSRLRAQLDALDDQIHDLLMRRAEVVESVARDGGKTGTKIRPGREAIILRRLLARHKGALPRQAIIRFWREMFGAALIIEGGQVMAVCGGDDRLALAREHFGPFTPSRCHPNPAQTLADLREGAQLAVVPPPSEEDELGAWWPLLTATGAHRLFVIAKLPFWTRRFEGAPLGEAYVVAAVRPDPSGDDRGLIVCEFPAETSRTRVAALVGQAGFTPGTVWVRRTPNGSRLCALVEVEGLVADDDPRLAAIAGLEVRPVVIGGYAVPLDDAA
ncbi:MAG TPA: chorismate mutase [Acidocella sp.]|jgi:chorismate mutase|nr:chorismate mutase [Acidocella sp.]